MKKVFKLRFLALLMALSTHACKDNRPSNAAGSTKMDSTSTVKNSSDTTLKADTPDMKTDTLNKTIPKKTDVKKTVVKEKNY